MNGLPSDFPERLARQIRVFRPGRTARSRFAPALSFGRHLGPPSPSARPAAVMMLVYYHEPSAGQRSDWYLPLTQRSLQLRDHRGQISLPGGLVETGETFETAALRELEEELGVPPDEIRLLGRLSTVYVFHSDFFVTPVLGSLASRPIMHPNEDEVSQLIEMPLSALIDPDNVGCHCRTLAPAPVGGGRLLNSSPSVTYSAPHIAWESHQIWGATAIMLGELIALSEAALS